MWDTVVNWDNDAQPANGDTIVFGSAFTSGTTIDLNGNRTIATLKISTTTGFSIINSALTITSGDITRSDVAGTEADQTISSNVVLGGDGPGRGHLDHGKFRRHLAVRSDQINNSATMTLAGTDRLIFDSDQSANLSNFSFTGYAPGALEFALGGGFYEVVAVPETSTWVSAALSLAGLIYWHLRASRRRFQFVKTKKRS